MIPSITADQNGSFSASIPNLQTVIDNTSLSLYLTCPRKYYYTMIEQLEPKAQSAPLEFGILYHDAQQQFEIARAKGLTYWAAAREAIRYALTATAKMQNVMGTPRLAIWTTNDSARTRETLIRSLVWYFDEYENDSIETVLLSDGRPAVELSFKFDLGVTDPEGEAILYSGHIDRVIQLGGARWIKDHKTTTGSLSDWYWNYFNPDNQMTGYITASNVVFDLECKGAIISAAQTGVSFTRFARHPIRKTKEQLDEWLHATRFWVSQMERSALEGNWPMNPQGCDKYGGCPFRHVCQASPKVRSSHLKRDFKKKIWDPTLNR